MPSDGSYWLRVRAIDSLGIEGRDATRGFTQHLLPVAPVALAPAPGTRFYTADMTLQWSAQAEAVRYHLQVSRDAQFGDVVIDRQVESGASAALGDLPPGAYYWRVAGLNASGESGDWSEPRAVSCGGPRRRRSKSCRSTRGRCVWRGMTRPGERYRLQLARDAASSRGLIADTTLDGGQFAITRPASGPYYARLQVIGADGVEDPFGERARFEVSVALWLKVLLSSTVLLPLLL